MFYIITFDDVESSYVKQLMLDLENYPNGTIFSYAQRIKYENLPKDKWIIWINNDIIEQEEGVTKLSNLAGIISVSKLNITKTVYDADWNWDDSYINNFFRNVI
jgi:hypothetical protein